MQQDKSFIYSLLYINYIKKTNYGWIFFLKFVQNSNILWGGALYMSKKNKENKNNNNKNNSNNQNNNNERQNNNNR